MAEIIHVRAARDDRRVVLNEAHPDHPGGEAWVVGDGRVVAVAHTAEVALRLQRGDLVVVSAVEVAGTIEEGGAPLELGELIATGEPAPGAVELPIDPVPTRTPRGKRGA